MQQVQETLSHNLMGQVKNILYPFVVTTMLAVTGISLSHAGESIFFTNAEYDSAVKKMSDSEWAYIIENSPSIISQPRLFMNCASIQSKNARLGCYDKVMFSSSYKSQNNINDAKDGSIALDKNNKMNLVVLGKPRVEISQSDKTKQLPILKIEERTIADRNMEVIKSFYQGELGHPVVLDTESTEINDISQAMTKNVRTEAVSNKNMKVIKSFYNKDKTINPIKEENVTLKANKKETSDKFFLNTQVIRQFYKTGQYQNSDKSKNKRNEKVPKNDKQKMSAPSTSPKSQLHLHQHDIDDFHYSFVNSESKWNVYTHLVLGNKLYITDTSM